MQNTFSTKMAKIELYLKVHEVQEDLISECGQGLAY